MVRPPAVHSMPQPERQRPRAMLALLLALAWAPALAGTEIQARLSIRTLAYGQPVELTLEARGDRVEAPDLSVLKPDFRILDRRVARQVSIRNGQRNSQVRLTLLLLPLRDGNLSIPAIPFGEARSEPMALTVEPQPAQAAASLGDIPLPPPAEFFRPPETTWPGDLPAPWPGRQGSPGDRAPVAPIDLTLPTEPSPKATEAGPGLTHNPWFWVSLGLAGALAGLLATRQRPSTATPVRALEPTPEPTSPSPLDLALDRVRAAYEAGDAPSARESLLAWARLRWPADPPGNLARLAQRCPPPLREHITRLEMAFFSPGPIRWEQEPVAAGLAALSAPPPPPTQTDPRYPAPGVRPP